MGLIFEIAHKTALFHSICRAHKQSVSETPSRYSDQEIFHFLMLLTLGSPQEKNITYNFIR